MSDSSDPAGEPVILPMRPSDHRDPPEPGPDSQPDSKDEKTDVQSERFWAGRSLAMRRSARVAA
ncbi:MAG: hypothetical protein ACLQLG_06835 [Thermoguttaceae bacterium]